LRFHDKGVAENAVLQLPIGGKHRHKKSRKYGAILIADEEFRVGERAKAEGVDIRSMTEAAGVA
jgi:hypothetical protein